MSLPKTVAIEDASIRLGVSPWTIRTWVRQGRVGAYKVGRRVLLREEDLLALLDRGFRPPIDGNGAPATAARNAPARATRATTRAKR